GLTLASSGVFSGDTVNFSDSSAAFASKNVGTGISIAVSGITDSGASAGNYTLSNTTATTSANITPKSITVTATGTNIVYNGGVNDTVTLASSGIISGDTVSFSDSSATFANANVGNGKTVTVSGITDSGASAGNYTLGNTTATATANITPYVLSLSGTRVYDANTDAAATLFGTAGVLTGTNGETLTLSGTGTLSGKNVGSESFASLSGFTLTGNGSALASNYTFSGGTDSVTITPLAITVAATAPNKVYNGTTADPGVTLASSGVYSGDTVNFSDSSATFASPNAGNGITVTASGITASGASASNYTLSNTTATTTANITPYVLSLTGTRVYDANTDAVATLFGSAGTLNGVAGQTLSLSGTGTLSSKNVGTESFASLAGFTLTGNGSALASNYTLTGGTDSVVITPATLTVSGTTAAGKVYDGTTTASLSGATLVGILGSDSVTLGNDTSGTFVTKNAGTNIAVTTGMTVSGADAGNYTLTQPSGITASITPYVLSLTGTRVYDANTDAVATLFGTSGVLNGVNGETLTLSGTGTLSSKNVGTESFASLAGFTLTGNGSALASNYTFSGGTDSVVITPATLTVSGTTAAGKVYDGTTMAALSGATLAGVFSGDSVTLGNDTSGTFASANVGTHIAVTTAMTISGADAGNYTLTQPSGLNANITPYVLSLTGTRVYDANTDAVAALFGTTGVLNGVNGETLTLSGTGTLSSKNVGTESFASLAGFTLTGNGSALASNYTLTGGTDSVVITPATLTVSGTTAAGKMYDGTTTASLSGATLVGVLGSDSVTLGNDTTGTFASPNAGNNISVTTAMTIGGTGAGNYTLTQPSGVTASITPYVLSLTGTRVYDANTDAAASLFGTIGVLNGTNGETLTLSGTGTLSGKNVGTESFASLAGFTLTGDGSALASNYTFTGGTDSVAITPATLTVAGTVAAGKVYDGTMMASLSGATLAGVLGGDSVTLGNDTTGTFASPNVGNHIGVTTAMTISGADAGNYVLTQPSGLNANITPYVLSLTGTRVYDANTDAVAALFGTAGVLNGVNGETLTLSGTGTLSGKNVGSESFASLSGFTLTGNSGALASNYTFTGGTDSVVITPATLTVSGTTAAGKVYDGTTVAALSGATLVGVLGNDSVTLGNDTSGTFATKNAGTNIAVTTGMTVSGADAGNYTLTQPTDLTADITPKPITVAATGSNEVYNGGTADQVVLASNGVLAGDSVSFTDSSATFATPTVGNNKTVTVSGIALTGASAGNYVLTSDVALTTADITPSDGAQQTAAAVTYLELSQDEIATPYGLAPSESPGELTSNRKMAHQSVAPNQERRDFEPGLALQVIDGGIRMPPPVN
ncbi:MAG TPA: YDG domain-containing protein, partial [Steroidobacteraceae bacterium]|nr:YDG domain-containing protein [Steroidobacteraceae bacterium]